MNSYIKDILNLSNLISLIRVIILIPVFYFLEHLDEFEYTRFIILALFLIAYISDLLDGYIARKYKQITDVGKIIDPLVDKIFVIVVVLKLYLIDEISSFYFYSILFRDLIIFLGGVYVKYSINKVLASNLLGKAAVLSIGIFLVVVIIGPTEIPFLYNSLYYISITLIFTSLAAYTLRAFETIKWYKRNENF